MFPVSSILSPAITINTHFQVFNLPLPINKGTNGLPKHSLQIAKENQKMLK